MIVVGHKFRWYILTNLLQNTTAIPIPIKPERYEKLTYWKKLSSSFVSDGTRMPKKPSNCSDK